MTSDELRLIEDNAYSYYVDYIRSLEYKGETLHGEAPKWTDVDRYYMSAATCYLPGKIIKLWITDGLWDALQDYLESKGVENMSDLATEEDMSSESNYSDFCAGIVSDAADYWWDEVYPQLCDDYFEEHAEISY